MHSATLQSGWHATRLQNHDLTFGLHSLRLARFFGWTHNTSSSGLQSSRSVSWQVPAMNQRKARLPCLRLPLARLARPACLVSTRMAWPSQRDQANDHHEWPAPAQASTAWQRKDVQHAWRSVASAANAGPSGQRAAAATQATHDPRLLALPCLCPVCASPHHLQQERLHHVNGSLFTPHRRRPAPEMLHVGATEHDADKAGLIEDGCNCAASFLVSAQHTSSIKCQQK